jgi:hypothetical protein
MKNQLDRYYITFFFLAANARISFGLIFLKRFYVR